jgi:hypothetical protein
MAAMGFLQHVEHVLEEFHMPALVAGYRNGLHVFLNGTVHDFPNRPIVAEMDHFTAGGLNDPPHYIDGGIVSVEQRRGRYDADGILGAILFDRLH